MNYNSEAKNIFMAYISYKNFRIIYNAIFDTFSKKVETIYGSKF